MKRLLGNGEREDGRIARKLGLVENESEVVEEERKHEVEERLTAAAAIPAMILTFEELLIRVSSRSQLQV